MAASRKLVLAVVDSLKPEMLDRAIAEGRRARLQGAGRARHLRARLRVHVLRRSRRSPPRRSRRGLGPDEHRIPSMNWYHRGEGRYVEYGSSFQATRAFGIVRSLYDTVYNMNLAHLTREREDGLRASRRTPGSARPARPTSSIGAGRATSRRRTGSTRASRARPSSGTPSGARPSSSTPTSSPRGGPTAARRSGCRASATSTRAASARTSSRRTCSTSCSSRCPTTTRTRTAEAPTRRSPRSRPRTGRSSE